METVFVLFMTLIVTAGDSAGDQSNIIGGATHTIQECIDAGNRFGEAANANEAAGVPLKGLWICLELPASVVENKQLTIIGEAL